eukprot:12616117-Heterocapsa_arctica.AAC.1
MMQCDPDDTVDDLTMTIARRDHTLPSMSRHKRPLGEEEPKDHQRAKTRGEERKKEEASAAQDPVSSRPRASQPQGARDKQEGASSSREYRNISPHRQQDDNRNDEGRESRSR